MYCTTIFDVLLLSWRKSTTAVQCKGISLLSQSMISMSTRLNIISSPSLDHAILEFVRTRLSMR
ncbi:MAG: hypothetical protein JSC085_000815 [Candidatus Tokpelaia sp. JSC085]|nr:MAG: hypothetical protein JSC085_000815 [Candidatus Tokpelaia sp. JSC085]